jgi:hypothetical protein
MQTSRIIEKLYYEYMTQRGKNVILWFHLKNNEKNEKNIYEKMVREK